MDGNVGHALVQAFVVLIGRAVLRRMYGQGGSQFSLGGFDGKRAAGAESVFEAFGFQLRGTSQFDGLGVDGRFFRRLGAVQGVMDLGTGCGGAQRHAHLVQEEVQVLIHIGDGNGGLVGVRIGGSLGRRAAPGVGGVGQREAQFAAWGLLAVTVSCLPLARVSTAFSKSGVVRANSPVPGQTE